MRLADPAERSDGFILVAVLLLVALVTVLIVVTASLARVERTAVSNETSTELARHNALFGLSVALAQLQKTAGPDQAITARADILDSNPATSLVDGFPAATGTQPNNPGQVYWTGVWKTGSAPPDAFYTAVLPAPSSTTPQRTTSLGNTSPSTTQTTTAQKVQKATWLVSDPIDPSTNLPAVLDPTATPSPTVLRMVPLAKNLPDLTGGATTVSVCAPLVSLYPSSATATSTSNPAGKYAYWVSDEGIKAKANLTDPTYAGAAPNGNSAFVQSQLHFVGPQAVATQDGLLGTTNVNDLRNPQYAADVPKVGTLQSLGNVQGTASAPAVTGVSGSSAGRYSPDVTTYSYGVLADVRNGGLKTDLSQLFEDPANQFAPFLTAAAVTHTADPAADQKVWSLIAPFYGNSTSQIYPAEFGIRWQSLYNYYSLYKSVSSYPTAAPWSNLNSYSNGNPGTPAPQMDARLFSYTSNPIGTPGGATQQQPGEYYMPHLIGFGVYFAMSSQQLAPTGSNPHDYNLILYAQPRVVLYNPYNVTLSVSKVGNNPYLLWLNSNILSRTLNVKVGGTTISNQAPTWLGTFTTNSNGTQSANTTGFQFQTDPAANFVLKPGEIRVYGLGTLAQASQFGYVTTFPKIGDQIGQSQWQYVGTDVSGAANPMQWKGNVPDSADVTVSFGGNGAFGSNNGFYKQYTGPNGGPGVWPDTSSPTNNVIGRFFNNPPNEAAQSADLGPISGMAVASPNSSAAIPFGYFVVRAKALAQSETADSALQALPTFSSSDGSFNPLPMYFDSTMQDTDFSLAVQNTNSLTEMQVTTTAPYNSYWGSKDVAINPNDPTALVLRDVPRQPMISLGQFMHMPTRTSSYINVTTGNGYTDTNSSMMGVGGSLADPYFTPPSPGQSGLTKVWDNPDYGTPRLDDNFLMNQALFDTYYLSTVPPPPANMDASYKAVLPALSSGNTAFTNVNIQNRTCVLPNSRMVFYAKNGVPPQTTTSAAQNYVPDYRKAAANLLLNGAFNVNSTSVPAWRALLSSLSGNTPAAGLYGNGPTFSSSQYPIFRFLSPTPVMYNGASSAVTTLASPNPWASINLLSEPVGATGQSAQVTALATSIVKQVKRLGPFLSMADFLNRRLTGATDTYGTNGSTTSIGLKGALQAAIDDTALVNINNNILALGSPTGITTKGARGNPPGNPILAQLPNNTAIGTPGCLMQQDLVQCFSPVMTVRSDTFIVRCYGEADNVKTGSMQGRAWGEAVIQRLPDYVDQNDPALTAGSNLGDATPIANVSVTNQTYGRRFKVVSFRWLNESDL